MNPAKNRELYGAFLKALDSFSSGSVSRPSNLDSLTDRFWCSALNNSGVSLASCYSSATTDYAKTVSGELQALADLRKARIRRNLGDTERELTSERQAYEELGHVSEIIDQFIIPVGLGTNCNFSRTMVNDAYNLALAQVQTAVNVADDEFIHNGDVVEAKRKATALARNAYWLKNQFNIGGLSERFKTQYAAFRSQFTEANPSWTRESEFVPTHPKEITHKERAISHVIHSIPADYAPQFIAPVAQGGIELGVRLDAHYHDQGFETVCYPLLFSIKTRRHRNPRISPDQEFFRTIDDSSILVTEDWVTTGKTLAGILGTLVTHQAKDVRVATIKQDPMSANLPVLANFPVYAGEVTRYTGPKTDSRIL